MNHEEFLTKVIDAGLRSIEEHDAIALRPKRLTGSRAGFEACRGKSPEELAAILADAKDKANSLRRNAPEDSDIEDYWGLRYFELQVEHVFNSVLARLAMLGQPAPRAAGLPTLRGAANAARIMKQEERRDAH